jgi:hypothetical protein
MGGTIGIERSNDWDDGRLCPCLVDELLKQRGERNAPLIGELREAIQNVCAHFQV